MRLFWKKKPERLPKDTIINEETGMTAGDVNRILAGIFAPELQRRWERKAERYFKIIPFLMLSAFFLIFLWCGTLGSPWNPLILAMAVFPVLISAILFSSLYLQPKMHVYLIYIALFANVIATILSVCKVAIPANLLQIPSSIMLFINIFQVLLFATFMFRIMTDLHNSKTKFDCSEDN